MRNEERHMDRLKLAGIFATLVIVIVLLIVFLRYNMPSDQIQPAENKPHFVGSETCIDCHKTEYDLWHGSDHYNAMDTASEASVLGDFNDVLFESKGIQSRFFRSGVKFMVHTQGPDGKFADFEIKYTFGVRPLQQYLIPFEGGRLQCLPLAWDTEKKRMVRSR